VGRTDFKSG